eukprot:gene763-10489_t
MVTLPPAPIEPRAPASQKPPPRPASPRTSPSLPKSSKNAAAPQSSSNRRNITYTATAKTTQDNTAPPPPDRPSGTRETTDPQGGRPPQYGTIYLINLCALPGGDMYFELINTLQLWDRIFGFDSLELLPVLAVAILSYRRENLLAADTVQSLENVPCVYPATFLRKIFGVAYEKGSDTKVY